MAESEKTPASSTTASKSYIPSFLFRKGQKGGKRGKAALRRVLEVRQTDVVSKSVDSLLAVASSISLPARAVLQTDNPASQTLVEPSASGTGGGTSPSGHAVRRHSYDVNALQRDTSEEFFDCSEDHRHEIVSDGDVTASSSSEASPRHYRGQSGLPDPSVRGLPELVGRARATNSVLGGAVFRGCSSSRDSLESDLDDRGDIDSRAFSVHSDDTPASLPGSPIIKVERFHQQVGKENAPFFVVYR
ncbi:hypothetical protein ElyMa_001204300 [Elysia marginata]|uniref:Uncharacterized protein n=1 Tax=Elysia marginata TaxID=1093978 RepID=A0AAV4I7Z8_9GAST|nr:hypothetical protein ElyMa_001204300 [Elysia marginata]